MKAPLLHTAIRHGVYAIVAFFVLLLLPACQLLPQPDAPPVVSPALTTPPPAEFIVIDGSPQDIAQALIGAERSAAISADLAKLSAIWAEGAQIVDGRTTSSSADDYIWHNRAAILDRYTLAVFPSPPPPLSDADFALLQIDDADETAIRATLGVDHWTFVNADGRWQISKLQYN